MPGHEGFLRMSRVSLLLLNLALIAGTVSGLDAQVSAAVGATVLDETDHAPIGGAVVSLIGSDVKVETGEDGFFLLTDLAPGPVTFRVEKPGYGSVVEQVDVGTAVLEIFEVFLPRIEIMLQELLVTAGSPAAFEERELRSDDRFQTALDLLANGVPGVSLSSVGGLGIGTAIQIRGVGTFRGDTHPSVYLDGVQIDASGPGASPTGFGIVLSALEAIPARDVARIQVLSGAAATARFPLASNGVILIETVKGGGSR